MFVARDVFGGGFGAPRVSCVSAAWFRILGWVGGIFFKTFLEVLYVLCA